MSLTLYRSYTRFYFTTPTQVDAARYKDWLLMDVTRSLSHRTFRSPLLTISIRFRALLLGEVLSLRC